MALNRSKPALKGSDPELNRLAPEPNNLSSDINNSANEKSAEEAENSTKPLSKGGARRGKMTALKIARCALMGAMIIGVKAALGGLPNFEMVTLLIILFAIRFGREVFWAVAVFNLCEFVYWGGGTWWAAYLYIWNLVAVFAILLRDRIGEDPVLWAAYSAVCGLFFGGLCSLVYIFIPDTSPWGYFISGLPWDIAHGIYNFLLMLVLFKPLNRALQKIGSG